MPQTERARLPRWADAADVLALLLVATAAYTFFFGRLLTYVAGVRLSVSWPRLAAASVLLIIVRHWRHPRPSLWNRLGGPAHRLAAHVPRSLVAAATIAFATRFAVLFAGYCAVIMIGYPPPGTPGWRVSADELGNLPARWDTGWYLGIAMEGYSWNRHIRGQQNLGFFPAFPILMRAGTVLSGLDSTDPADVAWAGTMVSLIAFFAALLYLYCLARDDIGEDRATTALALLASYPFAVFYSTAYSESVFLLGVVGAFYHLRRQQPGRAAGWGVLAGLARPNGFLLSIPLAIQALSQSRPLRDRAVAPARGFGFLSTSSWFVLNRHLRTTMPSLLCAAAPALAVLAFSAYTYHLTGYPFTWARLQAQFWNRDFQGVTMLQYDYAGLRGLGAFGFVRANPSAALNGLALLFSAFAIWPVTRRLGMAYGIFVLLNLALPVVTGGLVSIGRYSSVLFPLFIWLAAVTRPSAAAACLAVFAVGQGLIAALFFTWRPIF
jgi:Mannosyltransferase (PIG-V)